MPFMQLVAYGYDDIYMYDKKETVNFAIEFIEQYIWDNIFDD